MATMAGTAANNGKSMALARSLGWFSIGLGLAEILRPGDLAEFIGVPKRRKLIQIMGAREIASGVLILAQRRPVAGLWSRVAGDAADLALLGTAMQSRRAQRDRIIAATAAVAGVTLLDVLGALQLHRNARLAPIHIEKSIIVDRPAEELYGFWRRLENLPQFMRHLKSVQPMGGNRWHWMVNGPAGTTVEWDAEITADTPNELIAWRSAPGADVENSGMVRFDRAPGGRGTLVRVTLDYVPPGGAMGAYVAKLLGEAPEKQVPVELRRFKQLMETGDIILTEGQPAGRSSSTCVAFRRLRAPVRKRRRRAWPPAPH